MLWSFSFFNALGFLTVPTKTAKLKYVLGYAFDLTESCKCKAVSGGGGSSAFIELMVVLASVVTMSIIFTLIHCHRKKIGLFKAREEMR
jgi:hypothetical protein